MFISLLNGFITVCNLQKAFDTRGILTTPASDVRERLRIEQTAQRLKLQQRLLIINKRIIIR